MLIIGRTKVGFPVSDQSIERTPTVILIGAAQNPGPELAKAFAASGAKVIAIDEDERQLDHLAAADPSRIDVLWADGFKADTLQVLKDAWGSEPIDLVVNLMPLRQRADISNHMRLLSMILRTMIRGMIAGQGAVLNIVPRPQDYLALPAQGLWGAMTGASAALGRELRSKNLRVHVVGVPADAPDRAVDVATYLGSAAAKTLESTVFEVR